jgi:hypothetical protein
MAIEKQQYVNVLFEDPLLKRVEDFRFRQRFPSTTAAIKWLLDAALKARLAPKENE